MRNPLVVCALSAATLAAASFGATAPARAWCGTGCTAGAVAAGVVGGLALGAVAANAYAFGYGCYVADREVMDRWGNVYVRPVRVCR